MAQECYRVLLTSDIHCTDLDDWYGVGNDERMQLWLDTVLEEHEKHPFDLILIVGDISLDFHCEKTPYEKGYSSSKIFLDRYVAGLPKDVPLRIIAGNHEFGYTNGEWRALTGQDRSGYAILGENLFILLDSFTGELAHTSMSFIHKLMAEYPCHKVWLVSHFFEAPFQDPEFAELVAKNNRIMGLFMGHTHLCHVIDLGQEFHNKTIAQLGNFSFTRGDFQTTFWGFRDLLITKDKAVSRYLQRESDVVIKGVPTHIDARISDIVYY